MYAWDELLAMDSFKDHMRFAVAEDRYYSPLMQYTGLKDKNGTEIYEGDLIKVNKLSFESSAPLPEIMTVTYYGGMFQLFRGEESLMGLHLNYLDDGEVIGNIHQNPELLTN